MDFYSKLNQISNIPDIKAIAIPNIEENPLVRVFFLRRTLFKFFPDINIKNIFFNFELIGYLCVTNQIGMQATHHYDLVQYPLFELIYFIFFSLEILEIHYSILIIFK